MLLTDRKDLKHDCVFIERSNEGPVSLSSDLVYEEVP